MHNFDFLICSKNINFLSTFDFKFYSSGNTKCQLKTKFGNRDEVSTVEGICCLRMYADQDDGGN
jgi:hypothetical protein